MGHLFYIYVLLVSILVLGLISKFFEIKNIQEWYEKYQKVTSKSPTKEDFRSETEYNLFVSLSILSVLELILIMGGLLTNSWYIYISLFIFSKITTKLIDPFKFLILGKMISLFSQIIRFSFYIFLVINHFHLHLDIYKLIKS